MDVLILNRRDDGWVADINGSHHTGLNYNEVLNNLQKIEEKYYKCNCNVSESDLDYYKAFALHIYEVPFPDSRNKLLKIHGLIKLCPRHKLLVKVT